MQAAERLTAKLKDLQEEQKKLAKDGIKEVFAEFFAAWPEAVAIRWPQYSPYFNDGEPCVFRVGDASVKLAKPVEANPEDQGDDEPEEDEDGFTPGYSLDSEAGDRMSALDKSLEACEGGLLALFGDHVQVTIYRDKEEAEIEEYSHN